MRDRAAEKDALLKYELKNYVGTVCMHAYDD